MRDGRDISEIEEATRIRAKYLRALENEEWSLLPGPTYTKAFLRSYGDMLGLDGRMLVDEYKRQWEEPHELDLIPVRPSFGSGARAGGGGGGGGGARGGRRRRARWAGTAGLIVVLAVAVVLIERGGGSSSPAGSSHTLASRVGSGATMHAAAGAGSGTTTGGRTVAARGCASTPLPSDCVSLEVQPTTSVYVCLVADAGRIRIPGVILDARSPRVTYHSREFILTLGNTSARLEIDGHTFAIQQAGGDVRYEITAKLRKKLATPTRLECT
jgi:hypothetical protein